jgi:hypothetical protein
VRPSRRARRHSPAPAGSRRASSAWGCGRQFLVWSSGIEGGETSIQTDTTINGLYKAEVIHRRGPWRSFEAVEFATLEWVDWFNNRRLLEPIGNIPPAEAEERYYAMMEQPAMAA